jgi:hypothetical protein
MTTELEKAAEEFMDRTLKPNEDVSYIGAFKAGARWLLEWARKESKKAIWSHHGPGAVCSTLANFKRSMVDIEDLEKTFEEEK